MLRRGDRYKARSFEADFSIQLYIIRLTWLHLILLFNNVCFRHYLFWKSNMSLLWTDVEQDIILKLACGIYYYNLPSPSISNSCVIITLWRTKWSRQEEKRKASRKHGKEEKLWERLSEERKGLKVDHHQEEEQQYLTGTL